MKTITLPNKPQRARDLFVTALNISNSTIVHTLPFFIILILLNYGSNVLSLWLQESENLVNPGLVFVAFILMIALLYFTLAMFAGIIFRIHTKATGLEASFNDSFLMGCRKAIPFFVVGLIYSIIVGIGTVLLIIPGIIALFFLLFAPYLVVIDYGIISSFKESFQLVKDNWWRTVGNMILLLLAMIALTIVVYGVLIVIGIITQLIIGVNNELGVGFILFSSIVLAILFIFIYNYAISYTLAYLYDLQLRKGRPVHSEVKSLKPDQLSE